MTDILGHDVNGRPLRAGDAALLLKAVREPSLAGKIVCILGPNPYAHEKGDGSVEIDVAHPRLSGGWTVGPENLRRLDDRTDHQPSEYTYDELLDTLKTGAPNHAKA